MQISYVTIASNFVRGVSLSSEGTVLAKLAGAGYQQVRHLSVCACTLSKGQAFSIHTVVHCMSKIISSFLKLSMLCE
jgi:hypothetical protein